MHSFWHGVKQVLLWSYERGTWQYDLFCAVILAFIFFAPVSLFDGTLLSRAQRRPESPPVQKPVDDKGREAEGVSDSTPGGISPSEGPRIASKE